jgi:hypothetical protein
LNLRVTSSSFYCSVVAPPFLFLSATNAIRFQSAVLVSGLWGLLYFGEAPRGGPQWFMGALLCTGGIALLAMVSK